MRKRRVIGLIVAMLLVVGLGSSYAFYYFYASKKQAPLIDNATKEEIKHLNLIGDQTIAAQYAATLKTGNTADAQGVFDTAVAGAKSQQEKLDFLSQNISLALAYKQRDAALQAALKAIELQPSFATYNDAFRVYAVIGDRVKQKEMLQKAIVALQESDMPNKDQILPVLNQQMSEVDQQLASMGAN